MRKEAAAVILLHMLGVLAALLGARMPSMEFLKVVSGGSFTLWLHVLETNLILSLAALLGSYLLAPPFIASVLSGCAMGTLVLRLVRAGSVAVLLAMLPHVVLEEAGFLAACIYGVRIASETLRRTGRERVLDLLLRGFTTSSLMLVAAAFAEVYLFPWLLLFVWLVTP